MPFKKMTVREQIAAKRELRRLRRLERDIQNGYSGTRIASWDACNDVGGAMRCARLLGHIVLVRVHPNGGDRLVAVAYKVGGE